MQVIRRAIIFSLGMIAAEVVAQSKAPVHPGLMRLASQPAFTGAFNHLTALKPAPTLRNAIAIAKQLDALRRPSHNLKKLSAPAAGDWFIGLNNPDEVVNLSGNVSHVGNLHIVNRGKLILRQANFRLDGDIMMAGAGTFEMHGGRFEIAQDYVHEHQMIIADSAAGLFEDITFNSSGQAWALSVVGQANYRFIRGKMADGFITCGVAGRAALEIRQVNFAGEFIPFDGARLSFAEVDTAILWLVLPAGSVTDIALPNGASVSSWRFANGEPGVQGISYQLSVQNSANIWWGGISTTGARSTFRNSELLALGLIFAGPDSVRADNIVNNSRHRDETLNVSDRTLRLIDSSVRAWNFYSFGAARLQVANCIFGEIIAYESSVAVVENSICDGSGGYVSASHNAALILFRSLVSTQVISRDRGILVGAASAFLGSHIIADDFAGMALLNVEYSHAPRAQGAAVIFEEKLLDQPGAAGSFAPIVGTARLLAGPRSPAVYRGYEVFYSAAFNPPNWKTINGRQTQMVYEDTLTVWNTRGISAGVYGVQLALYHNMGDPIQLESSLKLAAPTAVSTRNASAPSSFTLTAYPNPLPRAAPNQGMRIRFFLPQPSFTRLRIVNLMGQEVARLVEAQLDAGPHERIWHASPFASGIYFAVLESEEARRRQKLVIAR